MRLFQTLIRFDPVYVVSSMRLIDACMGMCFNVRINRSARS